ncbi:MAG: cytochrome b N-terminal domain-containing protein, partial [Planctomycetota bacterium]
MSASSRRKRLLDWVDERTGWRASLRRHAESAPPGSPWLGRLWPSMITFAFLVQVATGLVLWLHYSPSAQTAWESVYYIEHKVTAGWLIRGVHHYAAQVVVALLGLYVVQLVFSGKYRRPGELVFWSAVLLGLLALALSLTGDLLAWDQNSYWSTQTRLGFLTFLPGVGTWLFKLAAGGPAVGHLTLTRFLALHIGVFAAGFFVLLLLHRWLIRKAAAADDHAPRQTGPYWSGQLVRNAAWAVVMVVILLLVFLPGDHVGVGLGAPADSDPANAYAAARPEWSFRGLYGLAHLFSGPWQIVPIFIIPTAALVFVLSMPCIALSRKGHAINVTVFSVLLLGLVWLSWRSYREDAHDPDYLAGVQAGEQAAARAIELAQGQGIPIEGAVSLLRKDPKTQGPRIGEAQCGVCHGYTPPEGKPIGTESPSAPELRGFAGRRWLAGFFDPDQIKSPKFYGNTRFAAGAMVRYVEAEFSELDEEEQEAIVAALSAEARLPAQRGQDAADADLIAKGRKLIAERRCTRCHRFRGEGTVGYAPDLTDYGSQEWLMG